MAPETCPNCGADVPRRAKSCPECGADEQTGWSDSANADRLGIPDDNFDYGEFIKEEFGRRRVKPRGVRWFWWITGLILLIVLLYFWIRLNSGMVAAGKSSGICAGYWLELRRSHVRPQREMPTATERSLEGRRIETAR